MCLFGFLFVLCAFFVLRESGFGGCLAWFFVGVFGLGRLESDFWVCGLGV